MGMMSSDPTQTSAYNGVIDVPHVGKVTVTNGVAQVEGESYYVISSEKGDIVVDSSKQPIGVIVNGKLQPLN